MDIVILCIRWFPMLLRKMSSSVIPTMVVDLPCDIIVDIFSRIPADLVFQCRREWGLLQALTSRQSFIDMHFERASSMILEAKRYNPDHTSILVDRNQECKVPIHLIDARGKRACSKYLEVDFSYVSCGLRFFGSHNGLLLFGGLKYLILWNPATEEKAIVKKMEPDYSFLCGFFMDTIAQECKIIFVIAVDSKYQFKLVNLRTKSSRTTEAFSHPPDHKPPVILEGSLYWFFDKTRFRLSMESDLEHTESIIVLDIYSENICTIAQPVVEIDVRSAKGASPQLMNLGKYLCFVEGSTYPTMDVWVMEDFTRKIWFRKHTIDLQFPGTPFDGYYRFTIIKSDKDDLVLTYLGVLYRYNLRMKTWSISKLESIYLISVYKASLVSVHDGINPSLEVEEA